MSEPFWFVWSENGNAPRYKHSSGESAMQEAERLARLNRGQSFVVLQSYCAFCVNDVAKTDLRPPVDDIPF